MIKTTIPKKIEEKSGVSCIAARDGMRVEI